MKEKKSPRNGWMGIWGVGHGRVSSDGCCSEVAHRSTSTGKMVMNEEQLIMEEMINDRPVQLHCSGTGQ